MPTAAEAYRAGQSEARECLNAITEALAQHEHRQAAKPKDWGFPGDIAHVNELLREVLQALTPGDRFIWDDDDIVPVEPGAPPEPAKDEQ
jgi:hypothetical protein